MWLEDLQHEESALLLSFDETCVKRKELIPSDELNFCPSPPRYCLHMAPAKRKISYNASADYSIVRAEVAMETGSAVTQIYG